MRPAGGAVRGRTELVTVSLASAGPPWSWRRGCAPVPLLLCLGRLTSVHDTLIGRCLALALALWDVLAARNFRNTWTDALHAARFSCLTLSLYHLEVGWFLYPFVLFLWPIACVYAWGRVSLLFYPILYSD